MKLDIFFNLKQQQKKKYHKFTKKNIKLLSRKFNWNLRYYRFNNKILKYSNIRRIASLRKLYSFYSITKRFLKRYYSIYKDKQFSSLHKKIFKKSKKRFYNQSFFFDLERRTCTLLFQCRLFSKLKYLKQLVLNDFLYVNNLKIRGYASVSNPLDFIHFNKCFYLKNFKNYLLSKNFYIDGLYDKHFKKILFKLYKYIKLKNRLWRSIYIFKIKRRFFFNYALTSSFYSFFLFLSFSNNLYNALESFYSYIYIKFLNYFYIFTYEFFYFQTVLNSKVRLLNLFLIIFLFNLKRLSKFQFLTFENKFFNGYL